MGRCFFIILFVLAARFTQAQIITVVSEQGKRPVENVVLFNKGVSHYIMSNEAGEADISGFKATDTIYFQHPSFKISTLTVNELLKMDEVVLEKRIIWMDEFVVSTNRYREDISNVAYMVDILDKKYLKAYKAQNAADLLTATGTVFVQKSQGGGGSPILRGMEANRVMLAVDGVKLNNAIYRSGHLQNALSIDNQALERVEVIHGPYSMVYGSDALGGVIHYYTPEPRLSDSTNTSIHANAMSRFATATGTGTAHLDFNLGRSRWASWTSFTISSFGDVVSGRQSPPYLGDSLLMKEYVDQMDGNDTILANPDPHRQRYTGYHQYDIIQKFRLALSRQWEVQANLQYSTTSDVDRYEMLNDYDKGVLKYAEWQYGPQTRTLAALKTTYRQHNLFFSNVSVLAAWQHVTEERKSRKYQSDSRLDQLENVDVASVNVDFLKIGGRYKLNYGYEYRYNTVTSEAWYDNIRTGEQTLTQTRYPDGENLFDEHSAYLTNQVPLAEWLVISAGARFNTSNQSGSFSESFMPALPERNFSLTNESVTGSSSLVIYPFKTLRIDLIAATGHRNPNLDDIGKVGIKGGSAGQRGEITIPNNQLQEEKAYNLEVGIRKSFGENVEIVAHAYQTNLQNAIVRAPGTYNGLDSMRYDGSYYSVITNTNTSEAVIRGINARLSGHFNRHLSGKATMGYTWGRDITNDVPLGHIPPVFGQISLTHQLSKVINTFTFRYAGWKRAGDMSPYGEDKEDETIALGYPAWYTINYQINIKLVKWLDCYVGVDNILDLHYKPFASAVAAPGRNYIATVLLSL